MQGAIQLIAVLPLVGIVNCTVTKPMLGDCISTASRSESGPAVPGPPGRRPRPPAVVTVTVAGLQVLVTSHYRRH